MVSSTPVVVTTVVVNPVVDSVGSVTVELVEVTTSLVVVDVVAEDSPVVVAACFVVLATSLVVEATVVVDGPVVGGVVSLSVDDEAAVDVTSSVVDDSALDVVTTLVVVET